MPDPVLVPNQSVCRRQIESIQQKIDSELERKKDLDSSAWHVVSSKNRDWRWAARTLDKKRRIFIELYDPTNGEAVYPLSYKNKAPRQVKLVMPPAPVALGNFDPVSTGKYVKSGKGGRYKYSLIFKTSVGEDKQRMYDETVYVEAAAVEKRLNHLFGPELVDFLARGKDDRGGEIQSWVFENKWEKCGRDEDAFYQLLEACWETDSDTSLREKLAATMGATDVIDMDWERRDKPASVEGFREEDEAELKKWVEYYEKKKDHAQVDAVLAIRSALEDSFMSENPGTMNSVLHMYDSAGEEMKEMVDVFDKVHFSGAIVSQTVQVRPLNPVEISGAIQAVIPVRLVGFSVYVNGLPYEAASHTAVSATSLFDMGAAAPPPLENGAAAAPPPPENGATAAPPPPEYEAAATDVVPEGSNTATPERKRKEFLSPETVDDDDLDDDGSTQEFSEDPKPSKPKKAKHHKAEKTKKTKKMVAAE